MSRVLMLFLIPMLAIRAEAQLAVGTSRVLHDSATDTSPSDTDPRIVADGNGNFFVTWYSFFNLGGTIGSDSDIFGARFTNPASAPFATQVINSHAGTDGSASDDRPRIGVDGLNNLVIAWESFAPVGGNGGEGDLLFSRSTNSGATWSNAANLNSLALGDSVGDGRVQLKGDKDGNWVAVWRSTNDLALTIGNDMDIFFVRSADGGATWSATEVLNDTAASDGTASDNDPVIATDGEDNWIVVWTSNYNLGGTIGTDNDVFYVTSNDDGATWSTTQVLNSDAGSNFSDSEVQIAHSNGTWLCVWRANSTMNGSGSDVEILFSTSNNNGTTWSNVALLNSTATTDNATDDTPSVAGTDAGFLVAWRSVYDYLSSGTDSDIFFSASPDGSTWSTAALLNDFATLDADIDQQPTVAGTNNGEWIVAWNSSYNLTGTISADQDVFIASVTTDFVAPNATEIAPATTGPTNATSISFTVTFDEAVQNFDDTTDLVITHSGTASTGMNISGGPAVYTVEITGLSGDGSFTLAVNDSSDVEDLLGNPLASSVTSAAVVIDNTPPTFDDLAVAPGTASTGATVEISFATASVIGGEPDVTVNGNPASPVAKSVTAYTYQYTVSPTDPLGFASIEVSGVDLAGNAGLLANNTLLEIVVPESPMPIAVWPITLALLGMGAMVLRRKG